MGLENIYRSIVAIYQKTPSSIRLALLTLPTVVSFQYILHTATAWSLKYVNSLAQTTEATSETLAQSHEMFGEQ